MSGTIQTVPFHGLSLSAVMVNGAPFVAIRPICEALGLDWSSQRKRINRDPELKQGAVVMTTPSTGGTQKTVCLPLDRLNGWLFGVDVARVREELRERLNWYRRECFEVLARHFGLSRAPADLHARLIAAEQAEAQSFAVASLASRAMNRRRKEKPKLQEDIQTLRESVQLALPLAMEGGAA
jgi:P22_AR N-terminal domain